jgi:Amt family ammonium transporter
MKKIPLYTHSLAFSSAVGATELPSATPAPAVDSGDTSWMLIATALVMLMTIPGLALFYGGLVRRKNVLNVLMQCFITMSVVSIEWVICGYSLSFSHSDGFLSPFIGNWIGLFSRNPPDRLKSFL